MQRAGLGEVGEPLLMRDKPLLERGEILGREVPEGLRLQRIEVDPVEHSLDLRIVFPSRCQRGGEILGLLGVVGADDDHDPLGHFRELPAVLFVELAVPVAG